MKKAPLLKRTATKKSRTVVKSAKDSIVHGPSSPDQVVAAINAGIRVGRYVAGQRLIEADLTRDHKVSRGPVREALKRLAGEGVVVLSPHRGAYIRLLKRSEAIELIEVVEVLIILAARLAATHIDDGSNRRVFEQAYKRLRAQRIDDDFVFLAVQRTHFYDAIVRIAGNAELIRINPAEQTQLVRLQVQPYLPERERNRQFVDYSQLAEAIRSGDPAVAERIMRAHTRRSLAHLKELPDAAFATEE